MVPSDRTVISKGATRLGAYLPEDVSRTGFRNVAFFFKLDDVQSPKKETVSMRRILTSKPRSVELETFNHRIDQEKPPTSKT